MTGKLDGVQDIPASHFKVSKLVVVYFLAILIPVEFNAGPIAMSGIRVLLLFSILPLLFGLFRGKFGPIIATETFFILFSIWVLLAMFINSPDSLISWGGSYILEFFGGYILARTQIRRPSDFLAMCKIILTVIFITLPFAVYETQTGRAPIIDFINMIPGLYSYGDFYNDWAGRRLGMERSQVIFSHPIHYGLFCSTALSLALVAFRGRVSFAFRYFIAFLVCLGVFFSVSSGALLPAVLQILLISWAWITNGLKLRWWILAGLVAVAYVVVDVLSNRSPVVVFLSYATLSPDTAYGRINIFEWGMANIWKHPVFGLGLNEWERPWWKYSGSMDNFWLLTTVRYGIPAFAFLAIGYLVVVVKVIRRDFPEGSEVWYFRRAWVFTQIGLILTLCTVDAWTTVLSYVFFVLGAGVWFISVQSSGTDTDDAAQTDPVSPKSGLFTRFPQTLVVRPEQTKEVGLRTGM